MSFDDLDFGEEFIGKPCTEFTPKNLLDYSFQMFYQEFGYKLPVDGAKTHQILNRFLKTYGAEGARLVKWMFYKYNGTYKGDVFSYTWWASGHQWWIDQRLHEMKKELGEVKKVKRASKFGFMSARGMLENGKATA